MEEKFDVIVIGGGHAGAEAAAAAARRGAQTLLLSNSYDRLGQMPCNPAVGGLAKGQLALEVDAMGGLMGKAAEISGIQFKTLNKSKGPAVQAPRAQCDRLLYSQAVRSLLENQPRLAVKEERVVGINFKNNQPESVVTISNIEYDCRSVVLCTGTFLRGKIYLGQKQHSGGRAGERAAVRLAEDLSSLGLKSARFKTCTPPRIDGESVDFSQFTLQEGDEPPPRFSYYHDCSIQNLRPCWQGATNKQTHRIIKKNLDLSPLSESGTGEISGVRYCPSIEAKVCRFDHHDQHAIFLEPEGLKTRELYVNGIFTSLPPEVQLDFIHSIEGLNQARVTRWGYGIEYDYFSPTQLDSTLELQKVSGLFFAGQLNGTTGYEEAAGQGLVAGINAAGRALDKSEFIPSRTNSYLGVLIDDLVTRGTNEPYRLFTSRAEHRLKLRADNAHYRLVPGAIKLELIDRQTRKEFKKEKNRRADLEKFLKNKKINPKTAEKNLPDFVNLEQSQSIWQLLKRPEVEINQFKRAGLVENIASRRILKHLEIEAKYEGYIRRQENKIAKIKSKEDKKIPADFDYDSLPELSTESKEKLNKISPRTLGQASRVPGIKPSDIQIIMVRLEGSRADS